MATGKPALRNLLAIGACLWLCACQGRSPDAAYRTYLERLGNTLAVEVPEPAGSARPRPPRSGAVRISIAPGELDVLDFLALSGCAVQVTIGKRNSSLGRMARPSQRLLLELEYLRLAPDCIASMREDGRDELADALETAWENKHEQLPALIFNATLGGEEYRSFWLASRTPSSYPAVSDPAALSALSAINAHVARWLGGDYRADNTGFEILLGEVAGGSGGALLRALARQGEWLAAANRMLASRQDRGSLCAPGIRHGAADILPNVIRKYFIEGIQPRSSALNQRYHELLPPVQELEETLENVLPQDYRQWRALRDSLFADTAAAPRRHVEELQIIQEPCGANTTVADKIG